MCKVEVGPIREECKKGGAGWGAKQFRGGVKIFFGGASCPHPPFQNPEYAPAYMPSPPFTAAAAAGAGGGDQGQRGQRHEGERHGHCLHHAAEMQAGLP